MACCAQVLSAVAIALLHVLPGKGGLDCLASSSVCVHLCATGQYKTCTLIFVVALHQALTLGPRIKPLEHQQVFACSIHR